MLKLSIIVPIYNVEPYLRKCVDSLLMQDLPKDEYEIILVDDGSPDGCPAICDEYAQALHPSWGSSKGANIVVIHQPNGGLSAARNSGLRVAQGKYIQFVDSDDYLEPNVLGELVAQVEREELDVLRFDYQNVRISATSTYEIFQPYKHPHKVDFCIDVAPGEIFLNERLGYRCYAWQFMVRTDLLQGSNGMPIVFKERVNFEDVEWSPRMLLAAKRVNSTDKVVYDYMLREGGITGTQDVNKRRKNIEDMLVVIDTLNHEMANHSSCYWLRNMRSIMASNILTMAAQDMYESYTLYLTQLKQKHVFPLIIADQGQTYARRAKLINLSPRLFGLLMHLRK